MKYNKAMIDVVELEAEDVVLTSTCEGEQAPCNDDEIPCRFEL